MQALFSHPDNVLCVDMRIAADNAQGGDEMPYFGYDFKEQIEHIYDTMEDGDSGQTLGQYACKVLSADYEALSDRIAFLLKECSMNRLPYPETDVSRVLSGAFEGLSWAEVDKMALGLKNIYSATQDDSCDTKDTVLRLYSSVEDYYRYTIWDYFYVIVVLQAYLEESAENHDMLIPENFEVFISAAFEDRVTIVGGVLKGLDLSDFNSGLSPSLDSDVREMVRDVFANVMPFVENGIVIQSASLSDFVASSIFYFFRNGYRFKRCKNCGRFFVPLSRADELYCDQPSPQDKSRSCKQYGSERLWYDRLKQDEAAKLARNIYMAKQMLVKRNPDILAYRRMFDYFKTERKKWEALVKAGEKTREEYIAWLNEMKARKTLK